MDEVGDLLTAWGIPDLIPTFARNGISIQSLSAINLDEIKELIPLIGPRALDENAIICQNIEDVDVSLSNSCNISLSDLGNINILTENDIQSTTTPQKIVSNNPEKVSPNITVTVTDNVELMQVLKDDFEATSLIQYVGASLPNENARNLLAVVIAKHILKQNKNLVITGGCIY